MTRRVVHRVLILILLSGFVSGHSCNTPVQRIDSSPTVQDKQRSRIVLPKDSWVSVFFKEIDGRAKEAKLGDLKDSVLGKDDLEVRIWIVVGYYGEDGLVLRRSDGGWSGKYVTGISNDPLTKRTDVRDLAVPRSGWEDSWRRLVGAGLLTLPDASEVNCKVLSADGLSYIVEANTDRTYRTYMYGSPQYGKCDQAKQMSQLVEIINEEFGLKWPTGRQ